MNKNKLFVTLLATLIVILGLPYIAEAKNKVCNAVCPSETELLSKLSAKYLFTYTSAKKDKGIIFFRKDPDVENGVKYDIRALSNSELQFGDGKGIVDHESIFFNQPGFYKDGTITSLGCAGTIQQGDSRIIGTCLSIDYPEVDTMALNFSARPASKISIFGGKIKRDTTCLAEECPGQYEVYDYLKSSYIFTGHLFEGKTERLRIDFDRSPVPDYKIVFNYDVFDANTNRLVFGSGVGIGLYRRVYFNLPIADLSGTLSTYNCNGVINPSTSVISGGCKSIDYDTTGQVVNFYGVFTAVPVN